MRFEHHHLLWLLVLAVPGLAAFFWWSWRARRELISRFVQSRLLAQLTVGVSTARQKARMALIVATVALIVIVLARPQWGFSWEEARQRGLDVVVAIDTSKSMLADDVAPNRLARAKLAALDLKRLARMDRMGLVAFAGSAFLQCPLSVDDEAFRQSVNALDVNIIPQGGTALAEAIYAARGAFKEKNDNHKILVIFTDGEDHDGKALEAAKESAKDGLRIFTIGVGSANGEMLRTYDAKGRGDFLRDENGNAVKSRLNESLLRQMAQSAEGFYMLLSGANTMEMLYERGLAPLPKAEFSARRIQRWHERFQWFLGAAILLLLIEMFLPERKPVRKTEAIVNAPNTELRKAVALALLLASVVTAGASPAKALKQYRSGRYDAALREYERELKGKPNDPKLHFNAGAAAFQTREYEQALQHFNSALITPDLKLQQQAYYNIGNTQYRRGDDESEAARKQNAWEQAISSYENALKLNAQDADAQFNLEHVKKKLEELKKQQEEQQKNDQQNKDDSKNEKDQEKKDKEQKQQDQAKNDSSKQDQSKQDQKQQQDQQKDSQSTQQKPQPDPQKDQQQQQSSTPKPDEKKDQEQASQSQQAQRGEKKDQGEAGEEGQAAQQAMIRMTPQQAMQLLDTTKGDEKAMIFIPQIRTNRQDRIFKDW